MDFNTPRENKAQEKIILGVERFFGSFKVYTCSTTGWDGNRVHEDIVEYRNGEWCGDRYIAFLMNDTGIIPVF